MKEKRLSRREQRGWTEARASEGPQGGPQTSPSRREAARREQARRDSQKCGNGGSRHTVRRADKEQHRATDPSSDLSSGEQCAVAETLEHDNEKRPSRREQCGWTEARASEAAPKAVCFRLEPEKRITPRFDPCSIAEFSVSKPGKMGMRVLDNCCEDHIM